MLFLFVDGASLDRPRHFREGAGGEGGPEEEEWGCAFWLQWFGEEVAAYPGNLICQHL